MLKTTPYVGQGWPIPPYQGEGYGDGLDGSLRDAGLRKPSVIDFGVTPATLIGLILPPPSCTRDACREDWIFRGDSWHDKTVSLRQSTFAGQQGGTPREHLRLPTS
jgi:hypothetical protein